MTSPTNPIAGTVVLSTAASDELIINSFVMWVSEERLLNFDTLVFMLLMNLFFLVIL